MHLPVLLKEAIDYLNPHPQGIYVDATIGEGGHAQEILKHLSNSGKLIGIDKDKEVLEIARKNLTPFKKKIILINENFCNLGRILKNLGVEKINGILFDLGVSSYQLEAAKRGFSFRKREFLDMRMDPRQKLTAYQIINYYPESKLLKILQELGEEPAAKRIVRSIIEQRKVKPIKDTWELVKVIQRSLPVTRKRPRRTHFATATFRALRMAVNRELEDLDAVLKIIPRVVLGGGRIVIITFHSLEDRLVKRFFARESKDCLCPKEQPFCTCHHQASLKILTKKPITPTSKEIAQNPRSRSAKLRAAEKI